MGKNFDVDERDKGAKCWLSRRSRWMGEPLSRVRVMAAVVRSESEREVHRLPVAKKRTTFGWNIVIDRWIELRTAS